MRRLGASLAAEVVVEGGIDLRLDVALRKERPHHVAAAIRIERIDGFVDNTEAQLRADGLASEVAGYDIVSSTLLRLEEVFRGRDVNLQLLLNRRHLECLGCLVERVVFDEERIDGYVWLRVRGDGDVEGDRLAIGVHDIALLHGVPWRPPTHRIQSVSDTMLRCAVSPGA